MTQDTTTDRRVSVMSFIEGNDDRLEVLNERPLVVSTPPELLAGDKVTPKNRLFNRNIQDLPAPRPSIRSPSRAGKSSWWA